ncbi:MAG: hypothetical protein UD936_08180 [Acutalibacteraceae bacterium]|nr:hypothetical protein [Acutalibacteraceae bacterium]
MDYSFMKTITNKVAAVIEPQGYQRQTVDSTQDYADLFIGEHNAYMVMYNPRKKLVALKVCGITDSAPDNQWKSMNTWIFDPETDGQKEANSIGNDFADALSVSKPRMNKSKKKNSDEGNADPKFLCKRLVNIFPDLKEEIWAEEDGYNPFRGVTFIESKVMPKIKSLVENGSKTEIEKLASILSTQYSNGDLDTRSIITIVILNGIKPKYDDKIEEYLSDELKTSWKYAKRYRNKKVKPEKETKPLISAETLNGQLGNQY